MKSLSDIIQVDSGLIKPKGKEPLGKITKSSTRKAIENIDGKIIVKYIRCHNGFMRASEHASTISRSYGFRTKIKRGSYVEKGQERNSWDLIINTEWKKN